MKLFVAGYVLCYLLMRRKNKKTECKCTCDKRSKDLCDCCDQQGWK